MSGHHSEVLGASGEWQLWILPQNKKQVIYLVPPITKKEAESLLGPLWILKTTYTNLCVLLYLLNDLKSSSFKFIPKEEKMS